MGERGEGGEWSRQEEVEKIIWYLSTAGLGKICSKGPSGTSNEAV